MYIKTNRMKANELRVNNIVKFIKPVHVQLGHIFDVINNYVSLSSYGIHLIDCDENTNVEPIPLTEEWILKFGFKYDIGSTVLKLQTNSALKIKFTKYGIEIGFGNYYNLSHVKYVHQLQNLYFALTGEELKIKL